MIQQAPGPIQSIFSRLPWACWQAQGLSRGGIRLAFGDEVRNVLGIVMEEVLRLVTVGIAVRLLGACTQASENQTDPNPVPA